MKIVNVNPTEIICQSPRFGLGSTDIMYSREREDFGDDEDLWDE